MTDADSVHPNTLIGFHHIVSTHMALPFMQVGTGYRSWTSKHPDLFSTPTHWALTFILLCNNIPRKCCCISLSIVSSLLRPQDSMSIDCSFNSSLAFLLAGMSDGGESVTLLRFREELVRVTLDDRTGVLDSHSWECEEHSCGLNSPVAVK